MDFISKILVSILSVLPDSPFQSLNTLIEDRSILSLLNCVIPFGPIVSILQAWVVCVAAYYVYKVIRDIVKLVISIL